MTYAAQSLIPSTTELGGKSPNIFFEDVMAADDAFLDRAVEGLVMYAANKGEICTCPSRASIHESIYEPFMARCLERIAAITQGDPLDLDTMIGAQVSTGQLEKIESYVRIGREEGAEVLTGGSRTPMEGELAGRVLLRADGPEGPQQDAGLPGGDLRPGPGGHHVQGRGGRAGDRQRHDVRAGRGRLDARRRAGVPDGARHQGRPRGPTATTSTRRTPRSAATRRPGSVARTTG
jgi:hypothetical protein